jgi:hypothetical protein
MPAMFRNRYLSEWGYVLQKDFPEPQRLGLTWSCFICPFVSPLSASPAHAPDHASDLVRIACPTRAVRYIPFA